MTFLQMQQAIATYLKNPVASFVDVNNNYNFLQPAINQTRHRAELLHDFYYCQQRAQLSIAATGSAISSATPIGGGTAVSIKRIRHVLLPIANGDYLPIEFMTNEELVERIRRQAGRQAYSATETIASYGVSSANPVAYQDGQNLYLYPGSAFTFPVVAHLDVIQFQPDYVDDDDTDFFLTECPDYIQWQSIVDGNRYWKEMITREEGNIQEQSPIEAAELAFQAMIQWDTDIRASTSSPVIPPAPTGGRR